MSDDAARARMRAAFEANAADILAYLERRVVPRSAAADVLGDAMEIAWRKVRALPHEPQQARMWLFVVARNVLANHRRGLGRHRAAVERLRDVLATSDAPHTDDERSSDVRIGVERALASLSPRDAEMMRLVHWDGFTLAEIAAFEGTPASTIRSRYAVALRVLAEQLDAHAPLHADAVD